jgi:hypothetical protein
MAALIAAADRSNKVGASPHVAARQTILVTSRHEIKAKSKDPQIPIGDAETRLVVEDEPAVETTPFRHCVNLGIKCWRSEMAMQRCRYCAGDGGPSAVR